MISSASAALIVSGISAGISLLAAVQNGETAQLHRRQRETMRTLGARAAVLYDQIKTIHVVDKGGVINNYLFPSIKQNVSRLEEALDTAISVGMIEQIVSNRTHAFPMYTAFLQSLAIIPTLSNPDEIRRALLDDHLTSGIIRLLDRCLTFGHGIFSNALVGSLKGDLDKERIDLAWTYLQKARSPGETRVHP